LNDLVAVKENINMKIQWYLKKRKNNLGWKWVIKEDIQPSFRHPWCIFTLAKRKKGIYNVL